MKLIPGRHDLLELVDAIYRVDDVTDAGWLGGLVASSRPMLDDGLGVVAWTFRITSNGLQYHRFVRDSPVAMMDMLTIIAQRNPEMTLRAHAGRPSATFTEHNGRRAVLRSASLKQEHWPRGVMDFLGILGKEPDGWGIGLGACLRTVSRLTAGQRRLWDRISGHLQAAHRLRRRLAGSHELPVAGEMAAPDGRTVRLSEAMERPLDAALQRYRGAPVQAVVEPSGRLLDARDDARERPAREALQRAAIAVDRTRARLLRRGADDEALRSWKALVEGRWSLIDHFESDGRRFLVARRNEPGTTSNPLLDPAECAVLGYRAAGHPLKLIAYEMGFSVSWTSRVLRSAMGKLGLRSVSEIGALIAPTPTREEEGS